MDRLTARQRKIAWQGFLGIVLVILGVKFAASAWQSLLPLEIEDQPALLYFTLEESCECMQELLEMADLQIKDWPETARGGVEIVRIDFDVREDLASQYRVFRLPCLVLVDQSGEIVFRQDYPLVEGGPFNLSEFEEKIRQLQGTKIE